MWNCTICCCLKLQMKFAELIHENGLITCSLFLHYIFHFLRHHSLINWKVYPIFSPIQISILTVRDRVDENILFWA